MNRVGVGRMLVASLHQGISDLIPTRIDFYENWLHPAGMRDGRIGLAPLAAVLSFLRQEGEPYDLVTRRAGEYAAQWTFDALPQLQRSIIRTLPTGMRARVALRLTGRVIRGSYKGSRATARLRKGQGTLTMRGSIFCAVREPFARPLCGYYAAALERMLALTDVNSTVQVQSCQGAGGTSCVIALSIHQDQAA